MQKQQNEENITNDSFHDEDRNIDDKQQEDTKSCAS